MSLLDSALRGQPDDLQLLRREVPGRAVLGRPAGGPGRGQLGPGAVRPGSGAEPLERLQRDAGAGFARRPCACPGAATRRTAAGCGPRRTGGRPARAGPAPARKWCSSPSSSARQRWTSAVAQGCAMLRDQVSNSASGAVAASGRPRRTAASTRSGVERVAGCGRSGVLRPASPAGPAPSSARPRPRSSRPSAAAAHGTFQAGPAARPSASSASRWQSSLSPLRRGQQCERLGQRVGPPLLAGVAGQPQPFGDRLPRLLVAAAVRLRATRSRTARPAAARSARSRAGPGSARSPICSPARSWPRISASPQISTRSAALPAAASWASAKAPRGSGPSAGCPRMGATARSSSRTSGRLPAVQSFQLRHALGQFPLSGVPAGVHRLDEQRRGLLLIGRPDELAGLHQPPVRRARIPAQERRGGLHLPEPGHRLRIPVAWRGLARACRRRDQAKALGREGHGLVEVA